MIVSKIEDKYITGFKVNDNIVADKKVIGSFVKNTAELQIINLNHSYDNLKGQYIDIQGFGKWFVDDLETDEEFTESTLKLNDITKEFDEDYEDEFPFPDTMKNWAIWIGQKVGVPLKGDFLKSDLILKERPFLGINPKFRDAVKFIAKITGNYAQKNYDNTYSIKWFDNTKVDIEDWEGFVHGNASKPVNVIVLSTGNTEDNVKWPEQDPKNPHELRIEDDWTNIDRYELNEAIYNQVNGFFYVPISKLEVPFGLLNLRAGQKIKTKDIELQDIETYISSVTLEWQGGDFNDFSSWTSSLKMEELNETNTKLKYANSFRNKLLEVERKTDKNAGVIEDTITSLEETSKNLEDLRTPILTKEGNNHICAYEAYETNAIEYNIKGKCEQESEPSPEHPSEIKSIKGIHNSLNIKVSNLEDKADIDYQEKDIFIDINKPNLFNFLNIINKSNINANGEIVEDPSQAFDINFIKVIPKKKYKLVSDYERQFVLSFYKDIPKIGSVGTSRVVKSDTFSEIVTVPDDYNYLAIRHGMNALTTEDNSNLKIHEGHDSFYELNSIKEVSDDLEVSQGILEKRIGKIVLDGTTGIFTAPGNSNENFMQINLQIPNLEFQCSSVGDEFLCTHFLYYEKATSTGKEQEGLSLFNSGTYYAFVFSISTTIATNAEEFKNWLKENPITIYYILKEPETIHLTPTKIPLFENENHLTLLEDIETKTDIKYHKIHAFNEAFYTKEETNAQLQIKANEINMGVENNKTEMKNGFLEVNEKLGNYALQQTLIEQINSVLAKITDSEARINILNQTIQNGVPITKTETGYTFDINGLNISSTDAEVNSTLSSLGLSILDNISKEVLLYAGYDKDLQETIVKARNMIIEKYFTVAHCRIEEFKDPVLGIGTGFFYVE